MASTNTSIVIHHRNADYDNDDDPVSFNIARKYVENARIIYNQLNHLLFILDSRYESSFLAKLIAGTFVYG